MKEIYLTVQGDTIVGYSTLKLLLETIGSSSRYWTALRRMKKGPTCTIDGMQIVRVPYNMRKKHG